MLNQKVSPQNKSAYKHAFGNAASWTQNRDPVIIKQGTEHVFRSNLGMSNLRLIQKLLETKPAGQEHLVLKSVS